MNWSRLIPSLGLSRFELEDDLQADKQDKQQDKQQ
jgi:hypothetical protein